MANIIEMVMNKEGVFEMKTAWNRVKGYASTAWNAVVKFSGALKDKMKEAAKKVWNAVKERKDEILVGTAASVAAGFAATGMGMAACVGAGIASAVMIAMQVLIAKRKKQAIDYRMMVEKVLGAAVTALITPYAFVYGFFGLTWLFDNLFYGSLYAYAYSAVLFVA
jgi:sensor c-di-GMP phosphodiesterase-like protein